MECGVLTAELAKRKPPVLFCVTQTLFNIGILFHIYLMLHVNCTGSYEYISHSEYILKLDTPVKCNDCM